MVDKPSLMRCNWRFFRFDLSIGHLKKKLIKYHNLNFSVQCFTVQNYPLLWYASVNASRPCTPKTCMHESKFANMYLSINMQRWNILVSFIPLSCLPAGSDTQLPPPPSMASKCTVRYPPSQQQARLPHLKINHIYLALICILLSDSKFGLVTRALRISCFWKFIKTGI